MAAIATNNSGGAICSLEEFLRVSYDYIIIGGGTAGLAVAAGLSEDPSVNVGVIEAGKDQTKNELVQTPALFPQMLGIPEYDWMLFTVPQKANRDKVHALTRGKMLGGSSATNGMMYVRGSKRDYDDWSAFGRGWSWPSMAPYFRRHETFDDTRTGLPSDANITNYNAGSHGRSGAIQTSFNNWRTPLERSFIDAGKEASGIMESPRDPWGGDHLGFFSSLATVDRKTRKGTRSYAASAYLLPNIRRPNLRILTDALAMKVILQGTVACGVRIHCSGQTHDISAAREVVLSCGTYKSPQILELSGIGDPNILAQAGVSCKVPLPGVGANLQDHIVTAAVYELKDGTSSFDALRDPRIMQEHLDMYSKDSQGILAYATSGMGFLPYSKIVCSAELEQTCQKILRSPAKTPFQRKQQEQIVEQLRSHSSGNIQFILTQGTLNVEEVIGNQGKFAKTLAEGDRDGFTIVACLQYPASRGTVHITSTEPAKNPAVDPAFLTHPADVDVLAAGLGFCDKIAQSSALKDKVHRRAYPPENVNLHDRAAASEAVKDFCMTEYHPCGTCAIEQVVDEKLKVYGVQRLRVVDASVFPGNVSGNILSTVYAVAEKAVDLIKEDSLQVRSSL
ncbi:hypothetical protein N7474_006578 [Penicillium riverlandense]|uniref:uncharacterized protein n=1 Tax=Penicillium riverlandense TaxID=1903569 RepID=UPI0025469224|nr:uncharacterized protein N7474_006578 [Penicillium riverlandense]KAJ5814801.1 hypothetical protein N7474_006578 [Penicillium riverlandense]